ncbi:hypothetical protein Cal6303_1679 [Calothrix sp. PCC 6303]|nr:hypothetical protein Cal6303_1679 [Calothrix sp. PCC 6303]
MLIFIPEIFFLLYSAIFIPKDHIVNLKLFNKVWGFYSLVINDGRGLCVGAAAIGVKTSPTNVPCLNPR